MRKDIYRLRLCRRPLQVAKHSKIRGGDPLAGPEGFPACGGLWRPVAADGGLWRPVAADGLPLRIRRPLQASSVFEYSSLGFSNLYLKSLFLRAAYRPPQAATGRHRPPQAATGRKTLFSLRTSPLHYSNYSSLKAAN